MAFPVSPTDGQIYGTYSWNSSLSAWVRDENTSWNKIIVEDTPRFMGQGGQVTVNFVGSLIPTQIDFNVGGYFNSSNGEFTCPTTGSYFMFFDSLINTGASSQSYCSMHFRKNGVEASGRSHTMHNITRPYEPLALNSIIYAQEGDTLSCRVECYEGANLYHDIYIRYGITFLG